MQCVYVISKNGLIVGEGIFNGVSHDYLLVSTATPAPDSLFVLLIGAIPGVGLVLKRRLRN